MSAAGPVRAAATSRDDWRTPPELFEPLRREFGFDLDAAANATNWLAHGAAYLGPGSAICEDALAWDEKSLAFRAIWCNPPYGALLPWVEAFGRWREAGHLVVALLPANTDTAWFARVFATAHEIRLLSKRVSFIRADGMRGSNTGGSIVAVWRPGPLPPMPLVWTWDWRRG